MTNSIPPILSTAPIQPDDPPGAPVHGLARGRLRRGGKPRRPKTPVIVLVSIGWLALLVLAVLLSPVLPLQSSSLSDYKAISLMPFQSAAHPLGTDNLGRDMLARLIAGAGVSLSVGIGSVLIGTVVGTAIGLLAGYFGGWLDRVCSWLTDVVLAFPALIAVIAFTAFLGPSLPTLVIGLAIVFVPQIARVARSATLSFTQRDFVSAAKAMGSPELRIMLRDILPNMAATVIAFATTLIAVAIVAEGGMSFLGLGVPAPQTSWGAMMSEGRGELRNAPQIVILPALAMCISLLAINFVAEWIGRRFDGREAVV